MFMEMVSFYWRWELRKKGVGGFSKDIGDH
jgi:hypothetical protein